MFGMDEKVTHPIIPQKPLFPTEARLWPRPQERCKQKKTTPALTLTKKDVPISLPEIQKAITAGEAMHEVSKKNRNKNKTSYASRCFLASKQY